MDININYIEKGSGEPLILLHGNGEDSSYFNGQLDAFARRSAEARQHAELLGLMVNDPAVRPEELAGIQAPTLVVAGTRDMIKEQHTRLIAASIPNAQLVILDGDHFVANKRPAAFNEAVLDFLIIKK